VKPEVIYFVTKRFTEVLKVLVDSHPANFPWPLSTTRVDFSTLDTFGIFSPRMTIHQTFTGVGIRMLQRTDELNIRWLGNINMISGNEHRRSPSVQSAIERRNKINDITKSPH
jgi:hypothetical protein